MSAVGCPLPPDYLGHGVYPAGLRRQAVHGFLDEPVGDRQDEVILAGEVPVNGGRVGTEGTPQLGQAEAVNPARVEEPQALGDNQLRRQAAPPQPPPSAPPTSRRPLAAGGASHRRPAPLAARRPGPHAESLYTKPFVIAIDKAFEPVV